MFEKILLFHFTENLNRHRLKLHYSQDLAIKRKPKNLSSSSNFCIVQTFILFSIWDLRFLRFSKRRPVDFIFTLLLHLLSCVVACWFVVRRRKICTFLFISELSIDLRCRISKFENENQFRESLTTSLRRLFLWTWTIAAATKCLIIDISTPTSTIRSFLFPFSSEQRSSKSLILESFLLFFFSISCTQFLFFWSSVLRFCFLVLCIFHQIEKLFLTFTQHTLALFFRSYFDTKHFPSSNSCNNFSCWVFQTWFSWPDLVHSDRSLAISTQTTIDQSISSLVTLLWIPFIGNLNLGVNFANSRICVKFWKRISKSILNFQMKFLQK